MVTISCDTPLPGVPAPSDSEPPVQPAGIGRQIGTLAGTAYEHSPTGIHSVPFLPLRVQAVRNGESLDVDVVTDAAGHYQVHDVQREYASVAVRPHDTYMSPCSVSLWLWSDDPVDVHVVTRATLLAAGMPRTMPPFVQPRGDEHSVAVEGYVNGITPSGLRPLALAMVEHLYGDGVSGTPTGRTLTCAGWLLCPVCVPR